MNNKYLYETLFHLFQHMKSFWFGHQTFFDDELVTNRWSGNLLICLQLCKRQVTTCQKCTF